MQNFELKINRSFKIITIIKGKTLISFFMRKIYFLRSFISIKIIWNVTQTIIKKINTGNFLL